jgi:polyhydroxybutyrate depolymerase
MARGSPSRNLSASFGFERPGMKRTPLTLAAVTILFAAPFSGSCKESAASPGDEPAMLKGTLAYGGTRTYAYFRPSGDGPFALVVALHGRFSDGGGQEKLSGLARVAAREHFIVVFPDGYRRSWNDGRGVGPAARHGIDDVGFLSRLIDQFVAHEDADPARVYAVGMSNGAMMSLTLACRDSQQLAGVVAVAGLLPRSESCPLSRPVAVAVIAGVDDPVVPYLGGEVAHHRGNVYSARQSVDLFGELDGCHSRESERGLPDLAPDDGTITRVSGWADCRDGSEVRLYSVEGGGHTWPGGWQYLGERWVGRTSRDFSASEELWRFLSRHRR